MTLQPVNCMNLSLQEMALRTAVVHVWNKTVALLSDENFRLRLYYAACEKDFETVENKMNELTVVMVENEVLKLVIPVELKKRMTLLVRPIGIELLNWQKFHKFIQGREAKNIYHIPLSSHLKWLSTGLIDYGETAKRLAHLESLDADKRYQFACTHCLVDDIPILWRKLSQETRERFYYQLTVSPWRHIQLESYWAYVLEGRESQFESLVSRRFEGALTFKQYIFEGVARRGNRIATEYFFKKLSDEEKSQSLRAAVEFILDIGRPNAARLNCDAPREKLTEVLFYILSKMSNEERLEQMRRFPAHMIACYFDWPWQGALLDFADNVWGFLDEEECYELAYVISRHILDSGYYLPDLLQQFFLRSPYKFKTQFVRLECLNRGIFTKLFEVQDRETVGVILGAIKLEDRRRLDRTNSFHKYFADLMVKKNGS